MAGNVTIDPRAWAQAVSRPQIGEVRSLKSGHIRNVPRLVRAFRYERAILLRQKLKSLVKSGEARLVCATCGVPVYLVCSTGKRFFFRHRHEDGSCPAVTRTGYSEADIRAMKYRGAQESEAHRCNKALLLRSLAADSRFEDVLCEQTWRSSEGLAGLRRPDISARIADLRLAFEVQLSTTFLDVVLSRREFYRTARALLIWVVPNFHPEDRRITDDDILFGNNSNIFVVDETTAAASEAANAFVMKCWHRTPVVDGNRIVDEWTERLVGWDDIKIDVDGQTALAFDYALEAAKLLEQIKADERARIAAQQAAAEREKAAAEHRLRDEVFRFVGEDEEGDDYRGRHSKWLALNRRLLNCGHGLEGKYPELLKLERLVHLVESAKAGRPVGFNYKTLTEICHHLFHQHPDLLLAFGYMLRASGTKAMLDADDRTGRWSAKVRAERQKFLVDPKYRIAPDEDRLLAFLSGGASQRPEAVNDACRSVQREAA